MRTRPLVHAPLAPSPAQLGEILTIVSARTGADFRGQRRQMLARRVVSHMVVAAAAAPEDYLARLREDEAFAWALLERLTVKVSRFFRNPSVFEALRARVVPALRHARGGATIHAWSAGCARGQEPYSLAMLLAGSGGPWAVRATDVDPAALAAARAGAFPEGEAADVPAALAARHLVALGGGRVAVAPRTAAGVTFGVHDVTSARDLPAAPLDLVCCRNVLIYFVRDVQAEILARLVGRIRPGGFLCLGEAEWPADRFARELEVVDRAARIFQTPADAGRRGGATA